VSARRIAIGTRGSALALAQARIVSEALERAGRQTRLVVIETDGDRRAPDMEWGDGVFVEAIEHAILDGRVDLAVHSAKDVPIEQDRHLLIAAYLPRADPRDALVVRVGAGERRLSDLAPGTRVGTDSPRRTGFVLAQRPDLVVHPIHGNVDTRLRRLDDGETDALLLACAGLDRLGRGDRIAERLAPDVVPPAPGQGAIAVQIRADDGRMFGLAAAIDDRATRIAVEAERAFLETSGGGCRAPIGALASLVGPELHLLAGHASPDGSMIALERRTGPVADGRAIAVALAKSMHAHRTAVRSTGASADVSGATRPRVLVTRARRQSEELMSVLRARGLEPVTVPAIEIEIDHRGGDLDRAAGSLHCYGWVIVTSANGARAILAAAERILTELGSPRWATVGAATSAVLEHEGIDVDFEPSRSHGPTLAAEMPVMAGDRILVLRGDAADGDLAERLRSRGAEVDDVIAYRTRIAPTSSRPLLREALRAGPIDALILTSGSTVHGLLALADEEALDIRSIPAVCIGPETARAAEAAGFHVLATSPAQDADTLAVATAEALTARPMEIA
jgi:hydroxymethylbilane synthase